MEKDQKNKNNSTNNDKPKRTKKPRVSSPSNGIAKSQRLLRSAEKTRARGKRSSDKKNALNLTCGKPMPPLSELEKMYESDEEMPVTTPVTTSSEIKTSEQSNSAISDGVITPTTVKKYADELLKILSGDETPQPIIPMKKYKKSEVPYIVGCTERPRIPENPNCNVFKGDDYGITSKTNAFADDGDEDGLKTQGFNMNVYSLSKSIFNAQANDIASYLLSIENKPTISRGSDSDDTVVYDLNSPKSRFSPEPSTSKDSETILKNDQKFIESFEHNKEKQIDEYINKDIILNADIQMKYPTNNEEVNSYLKNSAQANKTVQLELVSNTVRSDAHDNDDNIKIIEPDCEIIEIDEDGINNIKVKTKLRNFNKRENNRNNNSDNIVDIDDTCQLIDTSKTNTNIQTINKIKTELNTNKTNTNIQTINKIKTELNTNDSPIIVEEYHNPFDPQIIAEIDLTNINVDDVISENKSIIDKYSKRKKLSTVNIVEANIAKPTTHENISNTQFASSDQTDKVQPINDQPLLNINRSPNELEQITKKFFERWGNTILSNSYANNSMNLSDIEKILPILSQNNSMNNHDQRRVRSNNRHLNQNKNSNKSINQNKITNQNENKDTNPNKSTNQNTNNITETPREPFLGTCPICLDDLSRQKVGSTNCGHLFCMPCITTALKSKPKRCPTCRKKLNGQGYHQIFM